MLLNAVAYSQLNLSFQYDLSGNLSERVSYLKVAEQIPDISNINSTTLQSIRLSPNPTKDILRVDIDEISEELMEILVIDTSGRAILKRRLKYQTFIIDMSKYSSGIYFLKITFNGNSNDWKIMKL
jgi:hypothetical protein